MVNFHRKIIGLIAIDYIFLGRSNEEINFTMMLKQNSRLGTSIV